MSSLVEIAVDILDTSNPLEKACKTKTASSDWLEKKVKNVHPEHKIHLPLVPAPPQGITLCHPKDAPKRGKGGSLANRIAMLHSLCHIEFMAINLAWDIIARFAGSHDLPREFYDDWVRVAAEESKHFTYLSKRLESLGSFYGSLPAHDGLWQSALETKDSLLERLGVVHMVHEARGLDVHLSTVQRFQAAGDIESTKILNECIYPDEITHVAAGIRWFKYLTEIEGLDSISHFHEIIRAKFRGNLKPPFNTEAREQAGFTKEWYLPLSQD